MGFTQSPPAPVYTRAHGKTKCKYGNACYRECPHHWRGFDHDDSHPLLQPPPPSLLPPADAETDEDTDEDEPAQVMSPVSTEAALAAVVEEIAQHGSFQVGLVVGPTGSGKTRLLDALVARGIVGPAEKKEMWPQHVPVASTPAPSLASVNPSPSSSTTPPPILPPPAPPPPPSPPPHPFSCPPRRLPSLPRADLSHL